MHPHQQLLNSKMVQLKYLRENISFFYSNAYVLKLLVFRPVACFYSHARSVIMDALMTCTLFNAEEAVAKYR